MKFSYQIFIIIFVILSLFIIKDDLKPIMNRAVVSIENAFTTNTPSSKQSSPTNSSKVDVPATEPLVVPKKETTPGPLTVLTDIVTAQESILSVQEVLALTNKNRTDNGNLPVLTENSKLDASAKLKLSDMFAKQYFEHVSPNGVAVTDLGNKVGYEYIVIGENLALGNFPNSKALVDAWMASPGHRANILNTHYSQIGIAVGKGIFNGKMVWLAVQHFGLPKDACPTVDEVLHTKITLDKEQAKNMEKDLLERKARIDSGVVYQGKTTREQVDEYNQLVTIYNELVVKLRQEIDQYNVGVRSVNACIKSSTQ